MALNIIQISQFAKITVPVTFKKRMHQLFKTLCNNINNILNEIITELPGFKVSDPVNRKHPKFAIFVKR